nr:MarR family transcriptional regulator [Fundicoccus ignavus]
MRGGNVVDRTKESLNLFIAIMRTNNALSQIAKSDAASIGLNVTEFAVLELLYNRGEQPIQRIGERILIASSSTTYVVDKLCDKGLIERRPDTKDRRVTYASITEAGKEVMDGVFPKHSEHISNMFATLSEDELAQLKATLAKISRHG